tara:strand:- start:2273 stop:3565 length:1293 start_codon:yes stop_codon:yes gene_type:complete
MKKIVIYCGNGYFFQEFYYAVIIIISQIKGEHEIHFIIEDNHLSKNIIKIINKLLSSGLLKSFEISNLETNLGLLRKINYYNKLINKLNENKVDYFICGADTTPIMRIIITIIHRYGGKFILMPSGTLGSLFYKNIGKFKEEVKVKKKQENYTERIFKKRKEIGTINLLFYIIKFIINIISIRLNKKINFILDYKIYPFFLIGKTLSSKNLIARDIGGFCDYSIVFNQEDYKNIKTLIPSVSNLILAKHPMVGYCKQNEKVNNSNLLVLIGSISANRIHEDKIKKWMTAIKKINRLIKPSQIHIRFHPRERKKLIMQFEEELSSNKIDYTLLDSASIPLTDNICNYIGALGSPSGSLKLFRWATKHTFALCLENVTMRGINGNKVIMGSHEGIKIINDSIDIDLKMLIPPSNLSFNHYLPLKDCLSRIFS